MKKVFALLAALIIALSTPVAHTPAFAADGQSKETAAGIAQHKSWNWGAAISSFDKAIAADPNDFHARFFRAWDLCLAGKSDKAIEDCNVVIRLSPKLSAGYNNRAVNYFEMGDYKNASTDAKQALETSNWKDPFDPYTVLLLYLCERRMGHTDTANGALALGHTKCDANAWPYNLILLYEGRATEDDLLKSTEGTPKATSVKVYAGLLRLAAGDRKKARQNFRWAIAEGAPEGVGWDLALGELRRMEGINPQSISEAKSAIAGD